MFLGLYEYDIDDKKASALENAIGIKVIRHGMNKNLFQYSSISSMHSFLLE